MALTPFTATPTQVHYATQTRSTESHPLHPRTSRLVSPPKYRVNTKVHRAKRAVNQWFGALGMASASTPAKVLRAGLFTLVPLAYLSMWFWHPANAYGPASREGVSLGSAALMAAVMLVSLLSWNRSRLVAAFGLLACFLLIGVVLLPVL